MPGLAVRVSEVFGPCEAGWVELDRGGWDARVGSAGGGGEGGGGMRRCWRGCGLCGGGWWDGKLKMSWDFVSENCKSC